MKAQELLTKYPLTAKIVKDWFLEKMIESMNTDSVPEEFKQSILAEGISDDRLGTVIDAQPRALFDVFDNNDIIIIVNFNISIKAYSYEIIGEDRNYDHIFFTRKEAELFAVEAAFEILENKLTPIDLPKLEE